MKDHLIKALLHRFWFAAEQLLEDVCAVIIVTRDETYVLMEGDDAEE